MKLLDTTLLVDFVRKREKARRIIEEAERAGEPYATTEVNAFELLMGAYPKGRPNREKLEEMQRFLRRLDVLPLERAGALRAAELASKLRSEGKEIGSLDALIGGIALASGCDAIVTQDESFRRIHGLRVETY